MSDLALHRPSKPWPLGLVACGMFGVLTNSLLVSSLLIGQPGEVAAKGKSKVGDKRKQRGDKPQATPAVTPPVAASNGPLAAVRLACDWVRRILCVKRRFMRRARRLGDDTRWSIRPSWKHCLHARPSLRGCRNDSCRTAIAEQLGLWRLIDVIVHSPRQKDIVASVSIFDPAARGIAADVERESKRDPAKLDSTIGEAVEQVMATQRLTAQLRLDVRPTDAKVKITDSRGSAREISEPERTGKSPIRLFLGGYTVHVEKPGFLAQDVPVTVAQTGASLQIELQLRPIEVRFEWSPKTPSCASTTGLSGLPIR